MGFNWILLFEAYKYTTVSVATLSYYFAPVIVTVACPILFKEKMTVKQWICFLMSTIGIVLITGIGDLSTQNNHFIGILFGLGAACLYAAVVLLNKFIKKVEGIHRTFLQFIAAILVLIPYVGFTSGVTLSNLNGTGWVCLLIVGFVHTGVTYCLYFSSLKELPGQKAAILSYIDPLVAVLVSVLILGESMTVMQAIGGVLILGFTLWNEIAPKKKTEAGYSLTEKDVLLEISKTERCTANILIVQLGIDRSYMSRMLKQFEKKGLIDKTPSGTDSRIKYIRLTDFGREEFNRLSDIQNRQIACAFDKLSAEDVNAICAALVMTRNKLSDANDVITIRPFRQSDIEYVISRHKTLYYAERHLSGTFSAYVDKIVYDFVEQFNPETDCLNILECNGVPAGSIAIKKAEEGIARHVYETHGFYKVSSTDKSEWGEGVIEECWELTLIC